MMSQEPSVSTSKPAHPVPAGQIPALYRSFIRRHIHSPAEQILRRSAVVFAPHPDDESLGCGGTLCLKTRAGATVDLVFMTDGRNSHAKFIAPRELKTLRREEGLAAADILGIPRQRVHHFDFEDDHLSDFLEPATKRTKELLLNLSPEEIYIPCAFDPPRDHDATYRAVLAAVQEMEKTVTVYEYPVWFLNHWPLVRIQPRGLRQWLREARNTIAAVSRFKRYFKCIHDVTTVLQVKSQALCCHATQMTEWESGRNWPTLHVVADGTFLAAFFNGVECFHRYDLSGSRPSSK